MVWRPGPGLGSVMTRPSMERHANFPALQRRPKKVAAVSGGSAGRRVEGPAQSEPDQGEAASLGRKSGRERMVPTATFQPKTEHRPALSVVRRGLRLGSRVRALFAVTPSGVAASFLHSAISRPGPLKRFAGGDQRIPSPNIALAPFAASPPSLRTGRGSVPMDRRDVEAGPGATSSTWPIKCLSTHPTRRRPGLWCCAGTA